MRYYLKLCGGCKLTNKIFGLTLFLLAGCASFTTTPPTWQLTTATDKFSAIATIHTEGQATRQARLTWERYRTDDMPLDVVNIKTPFGTTQARLEIDGTRMDIIIGGQIVSAARLHPQIQHWLRILPPPGSIGYWLHGESDPNYSTHEILIPGTAGISHIIQHEWHINYEMRDDAGRPASILIQPPNSADKAKIKNITWLNKPSP